MLSKVSVIIPVKTINDFLEKETIPAILSQTYKNFEIIVIPDKKSTEKFSRTTFISSWPKIGPADKRDIGVKKAKGEILAFLDDDSYPDKNWLKNAVSIFDKNRENVAAVCGPQLTPPSDNLRQKASGYVWSSWLGSGGAGTYRCSVSQRREVDDFPTVNLLVRKNDFMKVGGFDSRFWPGEDTKLCRDLTCKLRKKIIYDPGVLVYHHRREVFIPHLKQISRYALHRGHFAQILPESSFRFGYFVPTFFVLGLIFGLILSLFHPLFKLIYLSCLIFYLVCLISVASRAVIKEKNYRIFSLIVFSIFTTHLVYGVLFIKGFFTPKLESYYHR